VSSLALSSDWIFWMEGACCSRVGGAFSLIFSEVESS
jgi:hypothetical protein